MLEETLLQYGAMGIFAAYLIYDRQVILKKFQDSIEANTEATIKLVDKLENFIKK
jgi:hypothetical protein